MSRMPLYRLKALVGSPGEQHWEEFDLPLRPGENVISALMYIEQNPVNIHGQVVNPIVWEQGCLEEVCGSCTMLVNGYPRQGCSTLIAQVLQEHPFVTLAPLTKFPLVRDLMVDRSRMFENLKVIQGWVESHSQAEDSGPAVSQEQQELMYSLSRCMTCGCCMEVCPQVQNHDEGFMGPAAIAQVRYFQTYPGDRNKNSRLRTMMGSRGIAGCGQAQNCLRACPKEVPLTESIAAIGRATGMLFLKQVWFKLFGRNKLGKK